MHALPVPDDDLEECWRDLRPGRFVTWSQTAAYVSLSRRDPEMGARLEAALGSMPNVLRVDTEPLDAPGAGLDMLLSSFRGGHEFGTRLIRAVRQQSRVRCRTISRVTPLGHLLLNAHDADIGVTGAFEEEFVSSTLWSWVLGNEATWGDEERALFHDEALLDPVRVLDRHRLLHFVLVGGLYELFSRAVIVMPGIERLVQTDLVSSSERRARAHQLNSLLEEVSRWNHHFSSCLTVVLGWSGEAEDAVLLRGLHQSLMQKIETSKLWLP